VTSYCRGCLAHVTEGPSFDLVDDYLDGILDRRDAEALTAHLVFRSGSHVNDQGHAGGLS